MEQITVNTDRPIDPVVQDVATQIEMKLAVSPITWLRITQIDGREKYQTERLNFRTQDGAMYEIIVRRVDP